MKKNVSLFFSLDRKEAKDQGCKTLSEYFIRATEKIKLVPISSGLKQKFSLFVALIHILTAKDLRPNKIKSQILLMCKMLLYQVGRLDTLISISGKNSYFKTSKCPKLRIKHVF